MFEGRGWPVSQYCLQTWISKPKDIRVVINLVIGLRLVNEAYKKQQYNIFYFVWWQIQVHELLPSFCFLGCLLSSLALFIFFEVMFWPGLSWYIRLDSSILLDLMKCCVGKSWSRWKMVLILLTVVVRMPLRICKKQENRLVKFKNSNVYSCLFARILIKWAASCCFI